MLSRAAEALFWIGRYVERAEDTARLLDVHFHEVLEDPNVDEAGACTVLLTVMGVPDDIAQRHRDSRALLELLGYDEARPNSIVGALVAARQNARGAREALSAEIWECLNATHNSLPTRVADARDFGPAPFFSYVRERAATFAGYVEASMSRDASHDVLVLGRSLERVDMTARMLAARIGARRGSEGWTSTLQACSAHDAYLRTYQQGVDAARVLEFLLVDRLFPRSVFHALSAGEDALARLDPESGRSALDEPARRAIGRARTDLEFLSAANLLDDLPDRLHGLQRTVSTVSEEVTRRLFAGSAPLRWSLEEPAG
ncbi:MAG TPA: alpha-E domain-containing protein [Jiangellaceae bacterium]|nr:alpha-E domain-containing protein [Jiangellaceae bacterium]